MSNKILFLDESGKTGTQSYSQSWNFETQPYFALCGILIDGHHFDELNQFVDSLRQSYKIQGEIKSTKKTVRKRIECMIEQIWDKQKELGCELYIEIVNKKFCIVKMIVEYCICPYYDIPPEYLYSYEMYFLRKCFANYIFHSISDQLLGEFVEFFDTDTKNITKMKFLCQKLIQNINNDAIIDNIKETLDSINSYEKRGLSRNNLFPLTDYYRGGRSRVAVSPHVDSFHNILTRIENEGIQNFAIIHDELSDLEDVLRQIVTTRSTHNRLKTIEFEVSKENNMLQLSDFWCGTILDKAQRILAGEKNDNSIIDEIMNTRVNFVSTFEEQERLFPNNDELKAMNARYQKLK